MTSFRRDTVRKRFPKQVNTVEGKFASCQGMSDGDERVRTSDGGNEKTQAG